MNIDQESILQPRVFLIRIQQSRTRLAVSAQIDWKFSLGNTRDIAESSDANE